MHPFLELRWNWKRVPAVPDPFDGPYSTIARILEWRVWTNSEGWCDWQDVPEFNSLEKRGEPT